MAFLFVAFPYIALVLAVLGGLYRYFTDRFSYSSLSSQLLEGRALYWASVPWHYGIIPVLLAHLFCGVVPWASARLLGDPVRLFVLELIGWALGLFALLGILLAIARRGVDWRARAATSAMDWILLVLLAIQTASGVGVALFSRWGSRWYLDVAVPWFWSIAMFQPDAATIVPLPVVAQLHLFLGFVLIGLFPFTRLVHIFTVPLSYLWRPYQVVIWNRRPAAGAGPRTRERLP
jgi:nitrate reductase gamma subunit